MNLKTTRALCGVLLLLAGWTLAGSASAAPTLSLDKIIGDLRGRELPNLCLSVAVDDAGTTYLLNSDGKVARYDREGQYLRTEEIPLPWPYWDRYLCPIGSRIFVGDARQDFPWVYAPQRVGSDPGQFLQPQNAALDPAAGQVYVTDFGNSRVQRFALTQTDTPNWVLPTPAKPNLVAVGHGRLLVVTTDQTLSVYDVTGAEPALLATRKLTSAVRRAAVDADRIVVAYASGEVLRYTYAGGQIADAGTLAPAAMASWPRFYPAGVPLTTAPDGKIWFATDTYYKLLALDPATDTVTEQGPAPDRVVSLAFSAEGVLYAGGYAPTTKAGPTIFALQLPGLTKLPPIPPTGGLYPEPGVPIWGMLPDTDGGVYVRVVEEGYQKGWPALSFAKVSPDGKVKPFADFGELYGKRRTFAPSEGIYSMKFDAARNILLVALPLQAVLKLGPDGKTIWEASAAPQGGADQVNFVGPRDLALDAAGNIWVTDADANRIFCLSPEGKLLLSYGHAGGIDDLSGEGLERPSGIAVSGDYLYVGDAGNYRLLKYHIEGE